MSRGNPCCWEEPVRPGKYPLESMIIGVYLLSLKYEATPQRLWPSAPGSKTSKIIQIRTANAAIRPLSGVLRRNFSVPSMLFLGQSDDVELSDAQKASSHCLSPACPLTELLPCSEYSCRRWRLQTPLPAAKSAIGSWGLNLQTLTYMEDVQPTRLMEW